jgi:hypothetical protein
MSKEKKLPVQEELTQPPAMPEPQYVKVLTPEEKSVEKSKFKAQRYCEEKEFIATDNRVAYYMVNGKRVRLRPRQVYKYKVYPGDADLPPKLVSVVNG